MLTRYIPVMLMLLLSATISFAQSVPVMAESNVAQEFELRYTAWRAWVENHPLSSDHTSCQEFKDIIALGPQVVPVVIEKLKTDRYTFVFALSSVIRAITQVRIPKEKWPEKGYGSSNAAVGVYINWWDVDRVKTPVLYDEYKQKWNSLKDSDNTEKSDFGLPLLWVNQVAYGGQWGLVEYQRRHVTEMGTVYSSITDLGIDVLPLIVRDIEKGYLDFIPIFVEITRLDIGSDRSTAPQRAQFILAWWEDHKDEWTIPNE